jgi:hypothetical protein
MPQVGHHSSGRRLAEVLVHPINAKSEALTYQFHESLPTVLDLKCIPILLVTLQA